MFSNRHSNVMMIQITNVLKENLNQSVNDSLNEKGGRFMIIIQPVLLMRKMEVLRYFLNTIYNF